MKSQAKPATNELPHRIEITLRDVNQLFNTMDASPFHEKDLDHDAEEFLESWVQEFPLDEPVVLVVHLEQSDGSAETQTLIEQAVHNYFAYRARMTQMEFRRMMAEGRQSLFIGLSFLAVCLTVSEALRNRGPESVFGIIREGLTIAGWVAMWHPMEIFLYEWLPVRRRGRVYEKMSRMKVGVD
jgi:hypothetical protein